MEIISSVLASLHFEFTTFCIQIVLFFGLHFALKGLIYTPILEARNKRDGKIAGRLSEAEAMTAKARQLKDEFDARVREARSQGQAMVQEELAAAEEARQKKVSAARDEARKVLDKANKAAEEARAKALAEVDQQVEHVAVAIATRILNSSLDEKDAAEAVAQLGGQK